MESHILNEPKYESEMKAYQFINYNELTNIKHIKKYSRQQSILCFDFEDSIKTSEKPYYRNCFRDIITNIIPKIPSTQIGLRVNSEPFELANDLEAVSNKFINSIILPKIENTAQIKKIRNLLADKNITYDELIPTIETKTALLNLEAIVNSLTPEIKRFGFGHCDYNLDIKVFPFFHQNSIEYWKWLKKIHSIISGKDLTILNSPYLELGNYSFFQSMLHNLYILFGTEVGQTTLTSKQSELINQFNPDNDHADFNKLIKHRLDLRVPNCCEEQVIDNYEKFNEKKTFSVLSENCILISPHEYLSAKMYSATKKSKSVNLTFVGGCFPVQNDIVFEDLFHQKLKRRIERKYKINFNINIIRYEQFTTCLRKISSYRESYPIDILVFHIRPEPFLRLVKICYRYLDNDGKAKYSLNLPSWNISNIEKYDALNFERAIIYTTNKKEKWFHKTRIDINYIIGYCFGNLKYAFKQYCDLTQNISKYCKQTNTKLLVLGVGYRNNTLLAKILCGKLNIYLQRNFVNQDIAYVENMSLITGNIDQYFQMNGIHASEKYHELIAELLFNELKNLAVE